MVNKFCQIVFAVFLLLGNVVSGQQIINDSIRAQLEIGIKGFQERFHAPSVVLAIVHKDNIIFSWASGYTDLENKTPATIDSKYQIQSVSKLFTAIATMQLLEKGVIGLDDDIRKYVPEFTGINRGGRPSGTTFLELSTHTSGLPRNSQADIDFAKNVDLWMLTRNDSISLRAATKEDFLKSLRTVSREYPEYEFLPPDTRQYSNMGYALLGLALERAAKKDFQQLVVEAICRPLKLSNTGYGTISSKENKIAQGYYYQSDAEKFVKTPNFYANAIAPAGGMYSTARDLARFISAQFSNTIGMLSANSVRRMQTFGIGWQRSYPFVKHEGAMVGFRTEVVLHPKLEVGWVILTNTTDFDFSRFNEYVSRLVLPIFADKPVTDPGQFVGTYRLEGGGESIQIYLKDGKLYSTYLEQILQPEPLSFSGNNALKSKGLNGHDVNYNFLSDGNSKIIILNLNQLMWVKE
ncbi:class A beta-lactamase-related serine hydrolase [Chitinophaga silvatica]|uniref:Class A beta-lactamase-related serine hydrolase n=1 Tax=Chitinophaga silvatica TaxID=2282649 RepID=A0A3E1Y5J2_9BACT|nr:serine hydrolase domain-containing protein [Chitinophaga silvatica]RFS20004.1 class A beta-lactamase-related serine hydrolase [Chitinophaga silvatica]